jgi:diguanylate cyclase (GGDEF)-like protein
MRAGDTVARLGGDEFAILVEANNPEEVASRVLVTLEAPARIAGRRVVASASVGIAMLDQADPGSTATALLQRADIAMYAAKRAGRGMSRTYRPDMTHSTAAELKMVDRRPTAAIGGRQAS